MFPHGTPVVPYAPLANAASQLLRPLAGLYAAHNLMHLAAYVASGLAMRALAWHLTLDRRAALLAGFLYMFSHYAVTQHLLGHLGESMDFLLPLAFLALLRLFESPGRPAGLLFAAANAGISLSTPYLAFAWLVGLSSFLVLRRRRLAASWKSRPFRLWLAGGLLAAGAAGLFAYAPLFILGPQLLGGGEAYSLSPLSFIDPPSWHGSEWVQALRLGAGGRPENLMGWFGLSVAALLVLGLRRGAFRGHAHWGGLLLVAVILSLGPFLQLGYQDTWLPLPYLVFKWTPYLGLFRHPSRLMVLAFLASSVLAALAFKQLTRGASRSQKTGLLILILAAYSWELGLPWIGRPFALRFGAAHRALAADPVPGAVLELPAAVFANGDVTVNAQEFMLYQPLHRRPLVVGRPPRHSRRSLDFSQDTDFVYELTHPHVIKPLYEKPELKARRAALARSGRQILRKNGIRYVLFHSQDEFFSQAERRDYARLLRDALGEPSLKDEFGVWLYRP